MKISTFSGSEAHQTQHSVVNDVNFNDLQHVILTKMWAPSIFHNNHRSLINFESTNLLVLDIDEKLSIIEAQKLFHNYKKIIATTRNHQKEKNGIICDRFRIILELERPITNNKDYTTTWFQAENFCPQLDKSCKDSSRFYFPSVEIVEITEGALWPVTQHVEIIKQSASAPADLPLNKKGQISKRAREFLINGAPKGSWHQERNNFVRECKQNNYSFEEMHALFCLTHTPDSVDEFQFQDVWARGVKHLPRIIDSDKKALTSLILRSKLIIDIGEPTNTILVDFTEGLTHDIHINTIRQTLDKETMKDYFKDNVIKAVIDYNPHLREPVTKNEQMVDVYNTYVPPEWRRKNYFYGELLNENSELPEIYQHFFKHLTDNHQESYNYLLDWIANSLQGQNLTILTAIGKQGVGKGTLGDILQLLHGVKNFAKVRDQVFKAQFNSPLRNKTLIYVDEIDLKTKEAQDRIKDVVNPEIEIEEKGIDAKAYRNYASFYISSNTMDAVRIDGDDRRFSIIQLTDMKIIQTPGYHSSYVAELKKSENIDKLARYLFFRRIERNMYFPFKSERYERVREAGLADWEAWVIEDWAPKHSGQTILLSEVQKELEQARVLSQAPGRRKFALLVDKYPEKISLVKSTGSIIKIQVAS